MTKREELEKSLKSLSLEELRILKEKYYGVPAVDLKKLQIETPEYIRIEFARRIRQKMSK